jgi:peroxiredoxin
MTRLLIAALFLAATPLAARAADPAPMPHAKAKVAVGEQAPNFVIKDATGKIVKLSDLTAKGPVLVRLTCGCSGCDKELAYFQKLDEAYKGQGLTSLYVFKEPDAKMAKYAVDKKISVLYAVDPKGESWKVWQTKSMPTNFLIAKGGKIVSVAAGCDPSGLLANKVSEKTGKLLGVTPADVKNKK